MLSRINGKVLAIAVAVVLLAATFFVFTGGSETRTATAHFSRAVSIYKGSEVRVMGVRIGTVTAVVPEGSSVRVEMTYDAEYKLPAAAKAAIVTPTLVADRFVQVAPAYTGGPELPDGGTIKLADSATPVELDRIYQSLSDLTQALGPNGANKDGALSSLLTAGADALRGNGELGNQTLVNLSAAVQTFGDNSGPLFNAVKNMSELTGELAANDQFVNTFMSDLTSVSAQLAGERDELKQALASLARVVGQVQTFVADNRELVSSDVKELTSLVKVFAKQKDSLNTLSRIGALGMGNLALAYDVQSGSIGSRVQFGAMAQGLPQILCDMVVNSKVPQSDVLCKLFSGLTAGMNTGATDVGAGRTAPTSKLGDLRPARDLDGLLGRSAVAK